MGDTHDMDPQRWGLFLSEPSRERAVARVEREWVQHIATVEKRSIDAGREAQKQVCLHRERERERLETLRELEDRIASASAQLERREVEEQRRLAAVQQRVAGYEGRLAELSRALREKSNALHMIHQDIVTGKVELDRLRRSLRALEAEEQQAKERVAIIQAEGAAKLQEFEAKFRAAAHRSNQVVSEAAERAQRLREEAELVDPMDVRGAQIRPKADVAQASSDLSSLMLSIAAPNIVQHSEKTAIQPTRDTRWRSEIYPVRHVSRNEESLSVPLSVEQRGELTTVLSQLEEQLRSLLVEGALKDLTHAYSESSRSEPADESIATSALMEF